MELYTMLVEHTEEKKVHAIKDHNEDVGLICSDPIEKIYFGARFPWEGIQFISKHGSLSSTLVNVNIYDVWERMNHIRHSTLKSAIACNGSFPYTENVTIANSTKAITASLMTSNINNKMDNIEISNCLYGIELKFDHHSFGSPPMNNTIDIAYQMTGITINNCHNGITIYNPSAKDVSLSNIKITNCRFGIEVINSLFSRFTLDATHLKTDLSGIRFSSVPQSKLWVKRINLCYSSGYYVTSPIVVNITGYFAHRRLCSLNFTTRSDHVLYVYIKSLVSISSSINDGNLTIIDGKTSKNLFQTEASKWNLHQNRYIRSVGNSLKVQSYLGLDAEFYIFDVAAGSKKPITKISETTVFNIDGTAIILSNFLQDVIVTDTTVVHGRTAIMISKKTSFYSAVLISNFSAEGTSNRVIYLSADYLKLNILSNTFENIDGDGVYCEDTTNAHVGIFDNIFKNNRMAIKFQKFNNGNFTVSRNKLVSNRDGGMMYTSITSAFGNISGNIFKRNSGEAVLLDDTFEISLEMSKNQFINNNGNAIVNLKSQSSSNVLTIFQNIWKNNSGHAIVRFNTESNYFGQILKEYLSIESNTFVENFTPSGSGILDIQFEGFAVISRNEFRKNRCNYVCKFSSFCEIDHTPSLKFTNNLLENNIGISGNFPEIQYTEITKFTVGIFGDHIQDIIIKYNIFNNQLMDSELFSGSQSNLYIHARQVDASFNWWGTSEVGKIESRIFDFVDWNDRRRIMFLPASTTRNFTYFENRIPLKNSSVLGGYINISKRLIPENSPYIVQKDLTVNWNSSITIDPGVTLLFKPQVGLLVLGNIFAVGTTDRPIKFCSFTSQCVSQKENPRRCSELRFSRSNIGNKFLEIYDKGSWKHVCGGNFDLNSARVACRELGFEGAKSFVPQSCNAGRMLQKLFGCSGNESSLLKCPSTYTYCSRSNCLNLVCTNKRTWGNIRIIFLNDGVGKRMDTDPSTLQNILISNAGYLHNGDIVPSIEIFNRFPGIKDVTITNSVGVGIQVVTPPLSLIFENVTINTSCSAGLVILGNKATIVVRKSRVFGTRGESALVIAPLENTRFTSFYGMQNLCGCKSRMFVNDRDYVYLQYRHLQYRSWYECSKVVSSPENTTLTLRILGPVCSDYCDIFLEVYDGSTTSSNQIAWFYWWDNDNQGDLEVRSHSNSMLVVVWQYGRLENLFLAEIIVNKKEVQSTLNVQDKIEYKIISNHFYDNKGTAIQFKGDRLSSSKLTITRNQITSSGRHDEINPSIQIIGNNGDVEISNNYIHENSQGGIHVHTTSSELTCKILNNVIRSNINGSESILVQAPDGVWPYVMIAGNELVLNELNQSSNLVHIKNFRADIIGNLFLENLMKFVLNWDTIYAGNKTGICEKNTFSKNSGYLQTIVLKGSKKVVNRNFIVNPANHYEIAVFPNSTVNNTVNQFDVRFNWLGYAISSKTLLKRIRNTEWQSDFPVVVIEPFLLSPFEIFERGFFCPLGWVSIKGFCYYYHGGVLEFDEAYKLCQDKRSSLIKRDKRDANELRVFKRLLNKRVFAKSNVTAVWIDDFSSKVDEATCQTFNGDSFIHTSCDSLYPTICQKKIDQNCLNSCFHNGVCEKASCKCNRGYEGEDCSEHHCRDVGNCGQYGTCVGPNYCRCRLGWKGRGCTVSYCPPLTSCKSCLSRKGCGWCDEQRRCLPGTAYRSDVTQCEHWFYYQCLSVGGNPQCSNQIKVIDCKTKLCNFTFDESNRRTCQQCMELVECFNQQVKQKPLRLSHGFCPTWNERRCPQGFVLKNYSDISRVDNLVTSSKLKVITSKQEVLYRCPNGEASVIVLRKRKLFVKTGDIISSTQAEGIFHKITDAVYYENYQLLEAIPASLSEAISYSDFSQEVHLQQIAVQEQIEDAPKGNLLEDFLLRHVKLSSSIIHTIGSNVNVYKCIGHQYSINGQNENVNTLFIAIPAYYLMRTINVGDVLVGNHSNGFLETVNEVRQDNGKTFIHTVLTECADSITISKIKNVNDKGSSCLGGDDLLGLQISNGKINVAAGEIVVGRKSGSFLGKVFSTYNDNGQVFIEIVSIVAQENGNVQTRFNFSQAIKSKRKRRDTTQIFSPTFEHTFKENVQVGVSSNLEVTGDVLFKPRVKVTLDIYGGIVRSVGVILSGKARLRVGATYNAMSNSNVSASSFEKSLTLNLLNNKKIDDFGLYAPGVFIPGQFLLNVKLKIYLRAEMKTVGTIAVDVSSYPDLKMGATWRKGHGVESDFALATTTLSNSTTSRLHSGSASLWVVLKPTFKVQWPTSKRNVKPNKFLWNLFGVCAQQKSPLMLIIRLNAPIEAHLKCQVCSEKCQDANKNIERSFRGGLRALNGILNLVIGNLKERHQLISNKKYEKLWSDCVVSTRSKPCCGNLSMPGKVNAKTQKCEILCSCSGNDPKMMGVVLQNGKCECDQCPTGSTNCQCRDNGLSITKGQCQSKKCPDGSWRQKRSQSLSECPCTCADGSEREMTANSTCPCDCKCADGSKDTIDSDGSCPCLCRCKGFETSTTGPSGCKCEEDRCPTCFDNEVAVWIHRKCLCREKYDCGLPPVCVDGRKGAKCLQPDCGLCKGCSGNGFCTTSSSCKSRCVCNWFWEGECCERRRPRRWWGDPHLETLDGFEFDYFGIGEFWNCKSVVNDFGMQTRFYAYKGVSLIGAVALKVGDSVVTITTCSKCYSSDHPSLRINGDYQSISARRFILANETVTLDIQKPDNVTNDNGTSLIVFAFQYKSGVTVSINVGYSPKMARQYINVQFAPIASFMRQTEGICGFMDDDSSNDLIGPSGEKFSDPIIFTDSWRVNSTHQDSGLLGSWSWNSSNFHAEDIMDESYTDINHKPIYTLDTLPREIVERANATCMALGLENNLLHNCIFDISVTNDSSFLDQQTLKLGCPNKCSGKGLCDNATCSCLDGWSGEDCSVGKCGNCSRGKCEGGFCQCEVGWEGVACDHQATCYGVDNCTSPLHGKCLTTNKCLCDPGYIGLNCSVKATCHNVNNCSSHGVCIDLDQCKCDLGWTGTTCEELSCQKLGYCSGNGHCVAFDVCQCSTGWAGPSCAIYDCKELDQCSKNGQCVGPNKCGCFNGYQGINCNATLNCSSIGDCNQNGVCVLNKELQSICSCYFGYTGANCSQYDCNGVKNCSGRGTCIQPNLCECSEGYQGESCSNFTCEKFNRCSGRGFCIRFDECSCPTGWSGQSCDRPNCEAVNNCSSNGTCIAPDKCKCYSMYDGELCNQKIQSNLNNPVFSESIYNATVVENNPMRYHVLTVVANDSDIGRSGNVAYRLVDNSIASYFVIDGETGRILTTKVYDYETLSQTTFTFTVSATDDGLPTRSAEATVVITIQDQNDNCPTFKRIPSSYNVALKSKSKFVIVTVKASDADSGKNGQIEYNIDKETNPDEFFGIGKDSGKLFVNKALQPGTFSLTIVARDLGDNPCIRDMFLNVVVDAAIIPTSSSVTTNFTSIVSSTRSTVISDMVETSKSMPSPTSSPTSSSISTTITSIAMSTSTVSTSMVQSSQSLSIGIFTSASSTISFTSTPIPFRSVKIDVRLTNKAFTTNLQHHSSDAYRNLKDELNNTLISKFEKLEGFLKISSVQFKKGSVIAVLSVTFSGSNNKDYANLLRGAIINATDSKGNIGQLNFDIPFLERSRGKTTNAPDDTKEDLLLPVSIIYIISGVVLIIIIAAVSGYCAYRRRKQNSKPVDAIAHENLAYDVVHPVELIDVNFKEFATRQAESMYREESC